MPRTVGAKISAATRKLLRSLALSPHGRGAELASELGISRQHLYSILDGRKNPSEETLRKLCRAVGLKANVKTTVEVRS